MSLSGPVLEDILSSLGVSACQNNQDQYFNTFENEKLHGTCENFTECVELNETSFRCLGQRVYFIEGAHSVPETF